MSLVAMITFTSDFGSRYAAAVRGVLLTVTDTPVTDVTHTLPRSSLVAAAFWIDQLVQMYPPAVHLIAADPARGASSETLIGLVGEHVLVGPDNGVCWPLATTLAASGDATPRWYRFAGAESRFPTRDVRGPLAARLDAEVMAVLDGCDEIETPIQLSIPEGHFTGAGAVGEVITVDHFGNLITSIPRGFISAALGQTVRIRDAHARVLDAQTPPSTDALAVTEGEHGRVEVVLGDGAATRALGIGEGDTVRVDVI